ncbi:hypothetical protein DMY87_23565 [Rhizobium wuzhouense]|uniref:Lytic murein transglycosylase n=1 Tax=Rhizobium wuzhouense TaxID=1986026 RepID=A0ABX5NK94_9HYPH|nr:hypothetical protein DMY87_23565 [Rhizobium wuzhouense]
MGEFLFGGIMAYIASEGGGVNPRRSGKSGRVEVLGETAGLCGGFNPLCPAGHLPLKGGDRMGRAA